MFILPHFPPPVRPGLGLTVGSSECTGQIHKHQTMSLSRDMTLLLGRRKRRGLPRHQSPTRRNEGFPSLFLLYSFIVTFGVFFI